MSCIPVHPARPLSVRPQTMAPYIGRLYSSVTMSLNNVCGLYYGLVVNSNGADGDEGGADSEQKEATQASTSTGHSNKPFQKSSTKEVDEDGDPMGMAPYIIEALDFVYVLCEDYKR